MVRLIFFLLLLGGLAAAAVPWVSDELLARSIGRWPVYDNVTGFLPAQTSLKAADAPLAVVVDMTTVGPTDLQADRAVLTMTATVDGRTVMAEALTFADVAARDTNPQTAEKVFRQQAGVLEEITTGSYLFEFGMGDAEGVTVRRVELSLKRFGVAYDPRLQPGGFAAIAIGFIGLVLSFRRGSDKPPNNPNSQPPPPRWGRNAGPPRP